jgi:hypothetical protein
MVCHLTEIALVVATWFAAAWWTGISGWLAFDGGAQPWAMPLMILLPPAAFGVAYQASATFRAFVLWLDQRLLISNLYRLLTFLYLWFFYQFTTAF